MNLFTLYSAREAEGLSEARRAALLLMWLLNLLYYHAMPSLLMLLAPTPRDLSQTMMAHTMTRNRMIDVITLKIPPPHTQAVRLTWFEPLWIVVLTTRGSIKSVKSRTQRWNAASQARGQTSNAATCTMPPRKNERWKPWPATERQKSRPKKTSTSKCELIYVIMLM